jgi:hypothetical protein
MFFSGGTSSFANRFRGEFPVHQRNDGAVLNEVPIAMVALVATAVSNTHVTSNQYLTLSSFMLP